MTRTHRLVAALALLLAGRPAAATPFGDTIQVEILGETIKQTLTMEEQLTTLRQHLADARENIAFMRSMYGLVSDFRNFDPAQFMNEAKDYFIAQNRTLTDANNLFRDLQKNGLKGRFDASVLNRKIRLANLYLEQNTGYKVIPYDYKKALGIGQDVEDLLADPRFRKSQLTAPSVASPTRGIIDAELILADPQAYAGALHDRAIARDRAVQAMQVYAESLGASPGKAQQLGAQAASLTAAGVAQVSETTSRQLALQELERTERSQAAAQNRREADSLWRGINDSIDTSFRPTPRIQDARP
jgi:hypothetical protein